MDAADAASDIDRREEERAIVARWRASDEVAFGMLMARWESPVKAVIGRIVLNAREAEELAQETFVRAWLQRSKFRAGAEFRPWLFAIAINLARNRLRWWKRRPTISLEAWIEGGAPSRAGSSSRSTALDNAVTPAPLTAAETLERAERAAAVRDAIAVLPLELREAIVLFEYEGLSHVEISEIVGATAKAVETRIYRAKQRLRATLRGVR